VFATTLATGTQYSGGFIGAGPEILEVLSEFADGAGIGVASLGLDGDLSGWLGLVAEDISVVELETNNSSDTVRGAALVANIDPASFDDTISGRCLMGGAQPQIKTAGA